VVPRRASPLASFVTHCPDTNAWFRRCPLPPKRLNHCPSKSYPRTHLRTIGRRRGKRLRTALDNEFQFQYICVRRRRPKWARPNKGVPSHVARSRCLRAIGAGHGVHTLGFLQKTYRQVFLLRRGMHLQRVMRFRAFRGTGRWHPWDNETALAYRQGLLLPSLTCSCSEPTKAEGNTHEFVHHPA